MDGNCFSSENNKETCELNVCTASTSAQNHCGVDNDCPIGFRCDTQKCAALKTANNACGSTLECDFGTTCVKKDKDTEATFFENWSLKNGELFTTLKTTNFDFGDEPARSTICSSGYEFRVGDNM